MHYDHVRSDSIRVLGEGHFEVKLDRSPLVLTIDTYKHGTSICATEQDGEGRNGPDSGGCLWIDNDDD